MRTKEDAKTLDDLNLGTYGLFLKFGMVVASLLALHAWVALPIEGYPNEGRMLFFSGQCEGKSQSKVNRRR